MMVSVQLEPNADAQMGAAALPQWAPGSATAKEVRPGGSTAETVPEAAVL